MPGLVADYAEPWVASVVPTLPPAAALVVPAAGMVSFLALVGLARLLRVEPYRAAGIMAAAALVLFYACAGAPVARALTKSAAVPQVCEAASVQKRWPAN